MSCVQVFFFYLFMFVVSSQMYRLLCFCVVPVTVSCFVAFVFFPCPPFFFHFSFCFFLFFFHCFFFSPSFFPQHSEVVNQRCVKNGKVLKCFILSGAEFLQHKGEHASA